MTRMNSFWELFLDTGAPEAYLLYRQSRQARRRSGGSFEPSRRSHNRSMYIKTDGIVLREIEYQDSDKLLTVLTREIRQADVRARGVKQQPKPTARRPASCWPILNSRCSRRSGRYVVTEAVTQGDVSGAAAAIWSCCRLRPILRRPRTCVSPGGRRDSRSFVSLLLNALYALGRLGLPQKLVKAVFELRRHVPARL